ncbi:hypothetical protein FRC07_014786 [Ceratobasidium sp. 392]|nr:hypothetical protein FRC07_014786 [Ceratobasidium sp. 392]
MGEGEGAELEEANLALADLRARNVKLAAPCKRQDEILAGVEANQKKRAVLEERLVARWALLWPRAFKPCQAESKAPFPDPPPPGDSDDDSDEAPSETYAEWKNQLEREHGESVAAAAKAGKVLKPEVPVKKVTSYIVIKDNEDEEPQQETYAMQQAWLKTQGKAMARATATTGVSKMSEEEGVATEATKSRKADNTLDGWLAKKLKVQTGLRPGEHNKDDPSTTIKKTHSMQLLSRAPSKTTQAQAPSSAASPLKSKAALTGFGGASATKSKATSASAGTGAVSTPPSKPTSRPASKPASVSASEPAPKATSKPKSGLILASSGTAFKSVPTIALRQVRRPGPRRDKFCKVTLLSKAASMATPTSFTAGSLSKPASMQAPIAQPSTAETAKTSANVAGPNPQATPSAPAPNASDEGGKRKSVVEGGCSRKRVRADKSLNQAPSLY